MRALTIKQCIERKLCFSCCSGESFRDVVVCGLECKICENCFVRDNARATKLGTRTGAWLLPERTATETVRQDVLLTKAISNFITDQDGVQ